jgi:hypothetical protein
VALAVLSLPSCIRSPLAIGHLGFALHVAPWFVTA